MDMIGCPKTIYYSFLLIYLDIPGSFFSLKSSQHLWNNDSSVKYFGNEWQMNVFNLYCLLTLFLSCVVNKNIQSCWTYDVTEQIKTKGTTSCCSITSTITAVNFDIVHNIPPVVLGGRVLHNGAIYFWIRNYIRESFHSFVWFKIEAFVLNFG